MKRLQLLEYSFDWKINDMCNVLHMDILHILNTTLSKGNHFLFAGFDFGF